MKAVAIKNPGGNPGKDSPMARKKGRKGKGRKHAGRK